MEENKLVPKDTEEIVFDEKVYGVVVERSKRKRKKRRSFKRLLIFAVIVFFAVIIVRNYSGISTFISSLFTSEKEALQEQSNISSSGDKNNNVDSENNDTEGTTESFQFNFIDTSPTEFIISSKNQNLLDINNPSFELPNVQDIYALYGNEAPVVLVVNFSPNECYSSGVGYSYTSEFYSANKNVAEIGEQLCFNLNSLGINTIHLKMDVGSYTLVEYQEKYAKEVEQVLNDNPSISYIFDISRSLCINEDMSINREFIELNGASVPTVKLVCGTDNFAVTEAQGRSIHFSKELSKLTNESTGLLVSELEISSLNLNLKFTVPCVRIEIGSYASTFEEASLTADYIALSLSSFLEK